MVDKVRVGERISQEALTRAGGSQSEAAKMLGINRQEQVLNRRLLTKKRKSEDEKREK